MNSVIFLVCLSTVDRRSRERFIESNNQIASLVEKFKLEGGAYRKYVGTNANEENIEQHQKIPLTAYGRPGMTSVLFTLIRYTKKNIHCVGISKACIFFSSKRFCISWDFFFVQFQSILEANVALQFDRFENLFIEIVVTACVLFLIVDLLLWWICTRIRCKYETNCLAAVCLQFLFHLGKSPIPKYLRHKKWPCFQLPGGGLFHVNHHYCMHK